MNNVHLMGRFVAEPELRTTTNGTKLCNFRLAVNRPKSKNNKDAEMQCDFFDCTAWNGTAELIASHVHRGDNVVIVGRLQNDNYTTAEGEKRYTTKIVVREFYFAGRRKADGQQTDADLEEMAADDEMV